MKHYLITIGFIILAHSVFSQWITEDKYKEAYKLIGADDPDDPGFEHVPIIDTFILKQTRAEIKRREQKFYNALDTLKKYKIYPDVKKPNRPKPIDSLSEDEKDSLYRLTQKNININYNYRGKRSSAFRTIFNYTTNLSLIKKHRSFLLTELHKTVFIDKHAGNNYKRYYSYLDISKSLRDSIDSMNWPEHYIIDARWGDTIAEQKIIDKFWNTLKDSAVDDFIDKHREIEDITRLLFLIDSKKTWDAFFKALQSDVEYYEFYNNEIRDRESGELHVVFYVETLLNHLLRVYNRYFLNDIQYFNSHVLNNMKLEDGGSFGVEVFYIQKINKYLSKKHKRKIKMKSYFLKRLASYPRKEFEQTHDVLPYEK